ncbi:uncharacterized protein LOC143021070 [Oratosquilla oratoria]|uniref:uncharacterized protein LOC143021070 n=1 Tax=Oratosquilla oratoria TaxID=337810 RepID=UPI003F766D40
MRRGTVPRAIVRLRELSPGTSRRYADRLPAIPREPKDRLRRRHSGPTFLPPLHSRTPPSLRTSWPSSASSSCHTYESSNSSKRAQVNKHKYAKTTTPKCVQVTYKTPRKHTQKLSQAKHGAGHNKTVLRKRTTVRSPVHGVTRKKHGKGSERRGKPLATRRNTVVVAKRNHAPAIAVTRKHAGIKTSKYVPVKLSSLHPPVFPSLRKGHTLTTSRGHALPQTPIRPRAQILAPIRGTHKHRNDPHRVATQVLGSLDDLLRGHISSSDASSKRSIVLINHGTKPAPLRKLGPVKMSLNKKHAGATGASRSKVSPHKKPVIVIEKVSKHVTRSETPSHGRDSDHSTQRKHHTSERRSIFNSKGETPSHHRTRPKGRCSTSESQTSDISSVCHNEIPETCSTPDVYTRLFMRSKSRMQKEEEPDVYTRLYRTSEEHVGGRKLSEPRLHLHKQPDPHKRQGGHPKSRSRSQKRSDGRAHRLPGMSPKKAQEKDVLQVDEKKRGLEVHSAIYNHRVYAHMPSMERL